MKQACLLECVLFVVLCVSRGDTHKNDVLYYCQQQAQKCQNDMNMVDRESAVLVWKLLELLIKQNGVSAIKQVHSGKLTLILKVLVTTIDAPGHFF